MYLVPCTLYLVPCALCLVPCALCLVPCALCLAPCALYHAFQVRKTAFGSVDAVPHRHFEDPAEAVRSLKADKAFVCALETTDGASSLFDVRFPLPPLLATPPTRGAGFDPDPGAAARGRRVDGDGAGTPPPAAGRKGSSSGGGQNDVGGGNVAEAEAKAGGEAERAGGGGEGERGAVLEEGGVVALVLGNEVTGVDERVLGLCDMVIEVRRAWLVVTTGETGWGGVDFQVWFHGGLEKGGLPVPPPMKIPCFVIYEVVFMRYSRTRSHVDGRSFKRSTT